MISWEEIERREKKGQLLLYDGLSGQYSLGGIRIYPSSQKWPNTLMVEPCKINDKKVFGVLKLTFEEMKPIKEGFA